jgi:hypothetical protein
MTYQITEYFGKTKETIVREATANEIADIKAREQKIADLKTQAEAKAAQRQALLSRLGITEEEASILLGGN